MDYHLQPLRTTQLLDRAIHLFRRQFLFFVLLCLPAVVVVVGTGELARRVVSVIYPDRAIQIFFAWIFQIPAFATAVGASVALGVFGLRGIESGQPYTVIGCYGAAARAHWRRIAGLQSLVGLRLIWIFFATDVVPTVLLAITVRHSRWVSSMLFPWRAFIGMAVLLLVVVSMIWMVHSFARHSFSTACCVVENTGIRASLKRSRRLAKGAKSRIWTMFFFALCLFIPLASVAELPSALAGQWVRHHKAVYESWTLLASLFAMAISAPIVVIGTTLVYYDQRVRREALDVQILIDAAAASAPPSAVEPSPVEVVPMDETAPVAEVETASTNMNEPSDTPDAPGAMAATFGS